ncbi:histone H2A-Bbd type 2/3-like [Pteropus medius]|uniref:histone H2A-Bbd type 2/3-like n=1 Tax=Pteropus vampyrus TaxID=132908 RepID=UPI00196A431E|nr:histone H2A-Bbd type 2/3-like [Pteropus giganteus]XP_039706414.1 histone H2A-Bbd type 2/3-like [Pteropus giganteus]
MPGRRSQGESSRRRRRRRSRARSRSARAELSFSVSHMERLLREGRYAQRLNWSTPIFLAAVIQYMTAKVLELAGDEAQKTGRRCITPEFLDMAVHNNSLLCDFFRTTIISQVAPPWD